MSSQVQCGGIIRVRWLRLFACMVATTVLSLSIHVLMFDVFGISHPDNSHLPAMAIVCNDALSFTAAIAFYQLAQDWLGRFPLIARCLTLTAIYSMLGEALLRNFIMDVVVSHDWVYCFVENLPRPTEYLITCSAIAIIAPYLKAPWTMAAGGFAIAAVALFAIYPPINHLFDRVLASIEYLDTGNIYNPPYDWHVDVPSYLTFLEPVSASFVIAASTFHNLSRQPWRRTVQFVALVMAMKGSIVPIALYSFYQHRSLAAAILSESQFTLEILAMAVLTAIGWQLSTGGGGTEADHSQFTTIVGRRSIT